MTNMTAHFKKSEVACGCGCGLLPSQAFMDKVETLRTMCGFPLYVSSCARCESHNEAIGGADKSHHIVTEDIDNEDDHGAIDIRVEPLSGHKRYEICKHAFSLGFTGIEIGTHHIHLDTRKTLNWMWTGVSK